MLAYVIITFWAPIHCEHPFEGDASDNGVHMYGI